MKYEFVAVVYNNASDTHDFLESLAAMDSVNDISCIIIDNSNIEDIKLRVKDFEKTYDFLKVVHPGVNLGYFGAFNFYFKSAQLCEDDIVILCNNDLIFSRNFVKNLNSKSYPDNVFVVCPDVITTEGVHQNPHVLQPRTGFQRIKLDLYFLHYYIAYSLRLVQRFVSPVISKSVKVTPTEPGYIHMGIGACYVLLPSFLRRFRHLNFPHFLYGEEAYLTHQVHGAGGTLYYDPSLKIQHKESATLSKIPKRTGYEFGRDGYWSYRKFY